MNQSLRPERLNPAEDKIPLQNSDNEAYQNGARAALIDVYLGNPDPTFGAVQWDGSDFLAWGDSGPYGEHGKLKDFGVTISFELYTIYLNNNTKEGNSTGYYGTTYTLPDDVFNNSANWIYPISTGVNTNFDPSIFSYNASKHPNRNSLHASAVLGKSIFWAPSIPNIHTLLYYK